MVTKKGHSVSPQKSPKTEILGISCFFWLLMQYCKHSKLNGLGSPFEGRKYSAS